MPSTPLVVCFTTVDRHLMAERALVMFCQHHPAMECRVVVVDDLTALFGVSYVASALPERGLARLALLHPSTSLVSAVRPAVLAKIVAQEPRWIVVIPDDSETVRPWADSIIDSANKASAAITLFANRFHPPPLDGKLPDAVDAAQRGRVDQDLLLVDGTDRHAMELLSQWNTLLQGSPHIPSQRLDPLTYPWLDAFAESPGVDVLTDARLPISIRNADESQRQAEMIGHGQLALVRFPGFDPTTPWVLSYEGGLTPRVRGGTLATIARGRADALLTAIADPADRSCVPAFDRLPNGMAVDASMRAAYASAMLAFSSDLGPEPPNPFTDDALASFLSWLNEPDGTGSTRYRQAYRRLHPELTDELPDDATLAEWIREGGLATGVPREFRTRDPESKVGTGPLVPGIEVKGYLRSEFGMGAAANALLVAARESGLPTTALVDDRTAYHSEVGSAVGAIESSGRTTSVLVLARNADALLADPSDAVAAREEGRKVVGFWFWEVAAFPDRLVPAFAYLDEIWVASEFVADALRQHPDAPPVFLFPYPLPTPVEQTTRSTNARAFADHFAIDADRFVVSFSFDYDSIGDRKNPWGVVAAYRKAFIEGEVLPNGQRPLLVLKAIGAERHPLDHDRLRFAIGDRRDVMLIEEHLESQLQSGLFARSNAYLSLHRGEGLGLTLVEAMAHGTPVVASAYGGNSWFTNEHTAFVVPHTLIPIPFRTPIYATSGQWADPDIHVAAEHLRRIATDPTTTALKVQAATEFLREHTMSQRTASTAFLRQRFTALSQSSEPPISNVTEPTVTTPDAPVPAPLNTRPGLGPVILPGRTDAGVGGGSGVRGAMADKLRSTVEPMIASQAAFEHQRIAAMVSELERTRQAVIDLDVHAKAERETLTKAITAVGAHTANLQANHEALYATVTELSTSVRRLHNSEDDLHAAISRIDSRLDDLTKQLRAVLDRLGHP